VKNRLLPWAVGVAILGCVLAVSANVTTSKIHENLNNERHARLRTEQQLQLAATRIRSLQAQLAESEKKFQNIQDILNQGRSTTHDLQSKLEQVTREKEMLAKRMSEIKDQPANDDIQVSR
jgi:peptidoglycan hydrolase CwlO-like protein